MSIPNKLSTALQVTLKGLIVPITILNIFGGVISGVWLAILGEWGVIIGGIISIVISGFIVSFALLPGLLFAAPAALAMEKGKKILGIFLTSLSLFYTVALITIWCIWILSLYVGFSTETTFFPLLIWSYGVALAPWTWLAKKDQEGGGNEFSVLSVFFTQISYILAMSMVVFGFSLGAIVVVFGSIMAIGAIFQMVILVIAEKQMRIKSRRDELFDKISSGKGDIADWTELEKPNSDTRSK